MVTTLILILGECYLRRRPQYISLWFKGGSPEDEKKSSDGPESIVTGDVITSLDDAQLTAQSASRINAPSMRRCGFRSSCLARAKI